MNELDKELCVPRDLHGQRVDVVLAKLLPHYSRSQLSQWLKQGLIHVNHRQLKPKDKVTEGDIIALSVGDSALQQQNQTCEPEFIPLEIVYEDNDLLVVNKQAGLIVHPGAGNPKHTLVNALLHHAPQLASLSRAGIVHRLDKDTTGLLVVAKTLPAHTSLVRQMQEREIQRRYITLVQGHVISGGEIDTFFGRHPRNRLKMAVCNQGRQAITLYTVKRHYDSFTLLDVQLLTGRTHQIRVHMAHINHPVIGDPLYGGRPKMPAQIAPELREALQSFKRQALHAAELSFKHPQRDELLTFTAPLPDDFQFLMDTLDEYLV